MEKQSFTKFNERAKEAFCKATCNGNPPRSTCTSLGTCDSYDEFCRLIKEGAIGKVREPPK